MKLAQYAQVTICVVSMVKPSAKMVLVMLLQESVPGLQPQHHVMPGKLHLTYLMMTQLRTTMTTSRQVHHGLYYKIQPS